MLNVDFDKQLVGKGPDLIADIAGGLPLPNGSVGKAVAEAFPSTAMGQWGTAIAKELFRVLQKGGKVEIQSRSLLNQSLKQEFLDAGFETVELSGNMLRATK